MSSFDAGVVLSTYLRYAIASILEPLFLHSITPPPSLLIPIRYSPITTSGIRTIINYYALKTLFSTVTQSITGTVFSSALSSFIPSVRRATALPKRAMPSSIFSGLAVA